MTLGVLLAGASATTASARPKPVTPPSDGDVLISSDTGSLTADDLRARFADLGVAETAWDGLIAKIEAGALPDSDSGAQPVSVETSTDLLGITTTKNTYADGSVSTSSAPAAPSNSLIAPMGFSGCQNSTSGGWYVKANCDVSYNAVTWSGSYYLKKISYPVLCPPGAPVASGPFGLVEGGIGISGESVKVLYSGVYNQPAWVRMNMKQSITILGVGTKRDVGFDLKVPVCGGTGMTLQSYGG